MITGTPGDSLARVLLGLATDNKENNICSTSSK